MPEDRDLATLIEQRRFRWQALQRVPLPDLIDSDSIDQLRQPVAPAEENGWIAATALSNGLARGPAYVVADGLSMAVPRTGYVLVCRAIDPGLTPLLFGAAAWLSSKGAFSPMEPSSLGSWEYPP